LPLADFKIGFSIEDKAEKPAEPEVQPAPVAAVPAPVPVVAPAPQLAVERAPVIEPRRNTIDRDSALARLAKIVARQ
jgi:hypothetical protein